MGISRSIRGAGASSVVARQSSPCPDSPDCAKHLEYDDLFLFPGYDPTPGEIVPVTFRVLNHLGHHLPYDYGDDACDLGTNQCDLSLCERFGLNGLCVQFYVDAEWLDEVYTPQEPVCSCAMEGGTRKDVVVIQTEGPTTGGKKEVTGWFELTGTGETVAKKTMTIDFGGGNQDECSSDADCPTGEECVDGSCQPKDGGGSGCSSNADCPTGEECVNGSCQPVNGGECSSNSDCPTGQKCSDGACVPKDDNGGGGGSQQFPIGLLVVAAIAVLVLAS